ncbi:protein translocase subunit SecD [Nocardioides sp.]|uniref:protein translocase subunit SecD n=1 Tax=Nocardioides sp. TaxID=35761 RepID=UPI003783F590
MARKTARPGRTLVVFFAVVALSYVLVAVGGTWKPALGLDLKGGTRITMIASGNPTSEQLNEAASIIDQRVNGTGVSEAEVTTQGNKYIVVEIPGDTSNSLVDTVTRVAQMRFRTVACSSLNPGACGTSAPTQLPSGTPSGSPAAQPSSSPSAQPSAKPSAKPSGKQSGSPKGRPAFAAAPAAKPTPTPSAKPTPTPSPSTSPSASPSSSGSSGSSSSQDPAKAALAFASNPPQEAIDAFNAYTCPADKPVTDDASTWLVTCGTGDDAATKYLLSPAAIKGTDLDSASAGTPSQTSVQWIVQLKIGGEGKKVFADLSQAMVGTNQQFAIVLDGLVISAPTFDGVITNGDAQISGNFTETTAKSLATSLKYGALPIAFEKGGISVEQIGASLAGDQLTAGITAGLLGLLLVMIYCLLYYRGLGVVVVASLVVAGAVTYSLVLLLGHTAGFTLTLPGIAGLIVAVGITADSFIVYFERIRDEMRDGKSMRVAVQAGWKRARNTCLAADTVSLLAAVVLYIFAAGVVKGFAFALGLSTLIDLAIFFWFTHPMVGLLSRYHFFNSGHKLSGLSAETLGVDRIATAGGRS